jgi:hypothetical protein
MRRGAADRVRRPLASAGSNFLLPKYAGSVPTTKISIAIDKQQLSLAREAAKTEGLSLSAYIARALGKQLEDQRRIDAARKLHASWDAATIPTAADRDAFLARMSRPRARRSRAA